MYVRLDNLGSPFENSLTVYPRATDSVGWFNDETTAPASRFGLPVAAPGYQTGEGAFRIKDIASTPQAFEVVLRPEAC